MANYTKQAASFTGLRGTVADPSIFDAEFNLIESISRTKADKELPNTFLQAQTFNKSPTIPAGGAGNQPLTATEISTNLNNRIVALENAINILLAAKAPTISPTLTGTPTAPTAASGDSSTTIASTAFVQQEVAKIVVKDGIGIGQTWKSGKTTATVPTYTNNTGRSVMMRAFTEDTRNDFKRFTIGTTTWNNTVIIPPNAVVSFETKSTSGFDTFTAKPFTYTILS